MSIPTVNSEANYIAAEINLLHSEIRTLHQEVIALFSAILKLIDSSNSVKTQEDAIQQQLGQMDHRLDHLAHAAAPPPPTHCKVCGSSLGHHPAPAGDLLCCRACGWSEFVGRDGRIEATGETGTPPPRAAANGQPWAA